ncbi:hypothetical protein [Pseudovibrio sp. Tun.PSC04-5.I4]|uniref:hypothetical protein n=1 Tax=Pseudovibrio sp. Tun.PSC04-5.I4 TaxID=1798213 RepID=UPI000885B667|nr:hypothetical protein [Pseudovibrio sp. Tun.PSC04-5.I4]SDR11257.1 hypothetical protein SAMN04515695_2830 [Pseudovibrio sp. Tun.PSC04-5.I4]
MLNSKPRQLSFTPRGFSRVEAAQYIGVSVGLFAEMITKQFMPEPRLMNTRKVWDIRELDKAFDELPYSNQPANSANSNLPRDFV